ncbi:50S ribosomal protein L29 [candidate division WOR-3 bacterium]|nr:50S ribosomal protein L29 [candidate division WOR-3 bacterium]
MKAQELHELTVEELESKLHDLREELFSLRFKHKAQSVSNPLKLRTLRRDIARILTCLSVSQRTSSAPLSALPASRRGEGRVARSEPKAKAEDKQEKDVGQIIKHEKETKGKSSK